MALFDEEDEDEIERLAGERDDPDSIGDAMRRARAREILAERRRMESPSTPEEPEEWVPDPEHGEELLREDEAAKAEAVERDAARAPARAEASRIMAEYDAAHAPGATEIATPDHEEPDADESGGPPDADADDLGSIGAAMDYDSAEAGRMTPDFDAYEAANPAPPDDPVAMAAFDAAEADAEADGPDITGPYAGTPRAPRTRGLPSDEEVASEMERMASEAYARLGVPPPTSSDPSDVLSFPGPPPAIEGFDRTGGGEDMDMRTWSDTPNDPEPDESDPFETAEYVSNPAEEGADRLASPWPPEEEPPPAAAPAASGPDYTAADWSDAVRRPLHAIGAGLLAASGRGSGSPFRSERAAMEEREGARAQAEAEAAAAQAEADRETARWDADRESRERIAADRESRMWREGDIRALLGMRRADTADERARAYGEDVGSRVTSRAAETAREGAEVDPLSARSGRARGVLDVLVGSLPESIREDVRAGLEAEGAGEWSAAEVEALRQSGPQWWRPYLSRAGGAAGGGGSAVPDEALNAELLRLGVDQSSIDAMTLRQRRDALDEMTGAVSDRTAGSGEAEIIDGVFARADLIGGPGSVERRDLRGRVIRARRASRALEALAGVAEEWGALGSLPETAEAEVAPAIRALMAYSTALGETGIISPGEVEQIQSELPNPSSLRQIGLDGFARRLEAWRAMVRGDIEDDLEARGVSPESMDRALGWIATGSFGGAAPSTGRASTGGGTVTIRDPETGETAEVPADALREADPDGYYEVVR